jgi:hypothetical protein
MGKAQGGQAEENDFRNRRRQPFQSSFQCFQQLQWLSWDCQTLESTRKTREPWVITVGDLKGFA